MFAVYELSRMSWPPCPDYLVFKIKFLLFIASNLWLSLILLHLCTCRYSQAHLYLIKFQGSGFERIKPIASFIWIKYPCSSDVEKTGLRNSVVFTVFCKCTSTITTSKYIMTMRLKYILFKQIQCKLITLGSR